MNIQNCNSAVFRVFLTFCSDEYIQQKNCTHHALGHQQLAELIAETGLPSESEKGLMEGLVWHTIASKYSNGPPEESVFKAIYNVWRSKCYVQFVSEKLQKLRKFEFAYTLLFSIVLLITR